jgi:hypothetical protein
MEDSANDVSLTALVLKDGEKFCHTNHFREDEVKGVVKGKWAYKDQEESPKRLKELQKQVENAMDRSMLERRFQSFILEYRPSPRKRHFDAVLGYFSFHVTRHEEPHLNSAVFCFGASA